MIKDLVNELESDKPISAIDTLELSAYVIELKNAMLKFESAYRERSGMKEW